MPFTWCFYIHGSLARCWMQTRVALAAAEENNRGKFFGFLEELRPLWTRRGACCRQLRAADGSTSSNPWCRILAAARACFSRLWCTCSSHAHTHAEQWGDRFHTLSSPYVVACHNRETTLVWEKLSAAGWKSVASGRERGKKGERQESSISAPKTEMNANAQTDQSAAALDKDQGSGWSVCCRCTCGSQQDTRSLFKAHVYRLLLKRPNYRQFQIHSIHCDVPRSWGLFWAVQALWNERYTQSAKRGCSGSLPSSLPCSIHSPALEQHPHLWLASHPEVALPCREKAYQLSCSEALESCHFSYEAP